MHRAAIAASRAEAASVTGGGVDEQPGLAFVVDRDGAEGAARDAATPERAGRGVNDRHVPSHRPHAGRAELFAGLDEEAAAGADGVMAVGGLEKRAWSRVGHGTMKDGASTAMANAFRRRS